MPPASKLSQLSTGLLLLCCQKELDEPQYAAIDKITFGHGVVQKRHSYVTDLERVLSELKMTNLLIDEIGSNDLKKFGAITYEPEEIINYYSGIFFDHVHQIKDKLLHLIALMTAKGPFSKPYNDLNDDKTVSKFMNKNSETLKKIGIFEILEKWYEESGSNISVVLKKRTHHHHNLSRLQLNHEFQNIKMSKLMLSPSTVNQLSDNGKKRMAEIADESFTKFKNDISEKQKKTISEIEKDIETISEKLIDFFDVPIDKDKLARISVAYNDFLSSFDIINETNMAKIDKPLKKIVDGLIDLSNKAFGDQIVSIYLVGSAGRGEFIPFVSDINFYIITRQITTTVNMQPPLNAALISEKDFFSEGHLRDRFICWSDGLLISGKKIDFNKNDFPKPGTFLCLLLNRDVFNKLKALKAHVNSLVSPTFEQLRHSSLVFVRLMMDFDFGIAMSNKPLYTSSRKKKIEHTKEMFPGQIRTLTVEQIYYGNKSFKQDDFSMLIDAYIESTKQAYQRMLDIEADN